MPSHAFVIRYQRYLRPRERARLIEEEERDNAAREGRWPRAVRAQGRPVLRRFPNRQAAENFAATLRACQPDTAEHLIAMQTAILVGLAPPDATEESHPAERDQVKPISHGSNYGISAQPKREKRPVPLRRKPGRSFHQGSGDVRACRVEFP